MSFSTNPRLLWNTGSAGGFGIDRTADEFCGCCQLARLARQRAEWVQSIRMVGLGLQRLPIQRFRLRQASGLVVTERCLDQGVGRYRLSCPVYHCYPFSTPKKFNSVIPAKAGIQQF
jgi:hypothetical protein